MDTLKNYLEKYETTQYKVSKNQGIPFANLSYVSKRPVGTWKVNVLEAVAKEIGKTPGEVLDEIINYNKK